MIIVRDISLAFGDRVLFNMINLIIKPGDKIGIVGRNGSGKSTLFKIISKEISPDEGAVEYAQKSTIGKLSQHLDVDENASPVEECKKAFRDISALESEIENVKNALEHTSHNDEIHTYTVKLNEALEQYHHLGGYRCEAEIERVLTGLGFDQVSIHRPTRELSGGWKMRIQLARLLLEAPDCLLLDEPTNHLDIEAILWLEQYLRQVASTVLLISHDKTLLDQVTQQTIEIDRGKAKHYSASYSKAMQVKQQQSEVEASAFKNQQREIAQKERLINKFRAKASKASFAKALQKELNRMEKIEPDTYTHADVKLAFLPAKRSGRLIVKLDNVNKQYRDKKVITGLNLQVERQDRIAFIGQNGQGKTTLAKLLVGEELPSSGIVNPGMNLQLAYYPQNAPDALNRDLTVLETLESESPAERRTQLRSILAAFLFRGEDVDKKVKVLSGGERARLALAKMLLHPANVIIMDEPTHHLDLPTKEILKSALMQFEGCLIVVSHDREFLTGLTTKIIEFRDGNIRQLIGDIKEYLESRNIEDIRMLEKKSADHRDGEQQQRDAKKDYERRKELQRKIKYAERDIETLEKKIEQIQQEILDPDFYQRQDYQDLLRELDLSKKNLGTKLELWEQYQTEFELLKGSGV